MERSCTYVQIMAEHRWTIQQSDRSWIMMHCVSKIYFRQLFLIQLISWRAICVCLGLIQSTHTGLWQQLTHKMFLKSTASPSPSFRNTFTPRQSYSEHSDTSPVGRFIIPLECASFTDAVYVFTDGSKSVRTLQFLSKCAFRNWCDIVSMWTYHRLKLKATKLQIHCQYLQQVQQVIVN